MESTHARVGRPPASVTLGQRLAARAVSRLHSRRADERGDVPGWVMVTVMSAMLVAALTRFVEPALTSLFTDAVERVQNGPG